MQPVKPARRAAYVYLIAESAGRVRQVTLDEFLRVEGVIHVDYHYAVGDHQEMTRDLLTAPGVVIVIAADQDGLSNAVHKVREIERAMYATNVGSAPLPVGRNPAPLNGWQ
jgi:hypothetical protein